MAVDVYLDNQDLSRLFKPTSLSEERIREDILSLKSDGTARYVFSMWHILEFVQKPAPGYEQQHRLKAQFLFDLCEYNALPFFADINSEPPQHEDRAIWLPRSALKKLTVNFDRSYNNAVEDRRDFNRKQRRALQSSSAKRLVRKNAQNVEQFVQKNLPLTEKFLSEQSLTKFIRGEISQEEFGARIAELFCSPPMFYDQWYEDDKRKNLLGDICINMGDKLVEALVKSRTAFTAFADAKKQAKAAKARYYESKRRLQQLGLTPTLDDSTFRIGAGYDLKKMLDDTPIEEGFEYVKHYFWKASSGHHQFKRNDVLDLLHLFYVPHVDLMRCDLAMSRIGKDCEDFDGSKIVERLTRLPERIRQAAQHQNGAL